MVIQRIIRKMVRWPIKYKHPKVEKKIFESVMFNISLLQFPIKHFRVLNLFRTSLYIKCHYYVRMYLACMHLYLVAFLLISFCAWPFEYFFCLPHLISFTQTQPWIMRSFSRFNELNCWSTQIIDTQALGKPSLKS